MAENNKELQSLRKKIEALEKLLKDFKASGGPSGEVKSGIIPDDMPPILKKMLDQFPIVGLMGDVADVMRWMKKGSKKSASKQTVDPSMRSNRATAEKTEVKKTDQGTLESNKLMTKNNELLNKNNSLLEKFITVNKPVSSKSSYATTTASAPSSKVTPQEKSSFIREAATHATGSLAEDVLVSRAANKGGALNNALTKMAGGPMRGIDGPPIRGMGGYGKQTFRIGHDGLLGPAGTRMNPNRPPSGLLQAAKGATDAKIVGNAGTAARAAGIAGSAMPAFGATSVGMGALAARAVMTPKALMAGGVLGLGGIIGMSKMVSDLTQALGVNTTDADKMTKWGAMDEYNKIHGNPIDKRKPRPRPEKKAEAPKGLLHETADTLSRMNPFFAASRAKNFYDDKVQSAKRDREDEAIKRFNEANSPSGAAPTPPAPTMWESLKQKILPEKKPPPGTTVSGLIKGVESPTPPMIEPKVTQSVTSPTLPPMVESQGSNMTQYLKATALIESDGKVDARPGINPATGKRYSSATGMFQFLDSTWKDTVKQMGKNYTLEDRTDPKKATEVMEFFTKQNKAHLEKSLGRQVNNTELYMGHFLGRAGAAKFLKNKDANPTGNAVAANPDAAAANPWIFYKDPKTKTQPRTNAEVYDLMHGKMRGAEQAITNNKWRGKEVPESVAQIKSLDSGGDRPVIMAAQTTSDSTILAPVQQREEIQGPPNIRPSAPVATSLPERPGPILAPVQQREEIQGPPVIASSRLPDIAAAPGATPPIAPVDTQYPVGRGPVLAPVSGGYPMGGMPPVRSGPPLVGGISIGTGPNGKLGGSVSLGGIIPGLPGVLGDITLGRYGNKTVGGVGVRGNIPGTTIGGSVGVGRNMNGATTGGISIGSPMGGMVQSMPRIITGGYPSMPASGGVSIGTGPNGVTGRAGVGGISIPGLPGVTGSVGVGRDPSGRTSGSVGMGGVIGPGVTGSVGIGTNPFGGVSGGINMGGIITPTAPPIAPSTKIEPVAIAPTSGRAINEISNQNSSLREERSAAKPSAPVIVNNSSTSMPQRAPTQLGDDIADPRADWRNPFSRYQDKILHYT